MNQAGELARGTLLIIGVNGFCMSGMDVLTILLYPAW